MKANFRRGGLFLLPSVAFAAIIAVLLNAPTPALVSICAFGFVTAVILLLLGDRRSEKG